MTNKKILMDVFAILIHSTTNVTSYSSLTRTKMVIFPIIIMMMMMNIHKK
jgi:hypothetical protein